jgi:hypothetical protein
VDSSRTDIKVRLYGEFKTRVYREHSDQRWLGHVLGSLCHNWGYSDIWNWSHRKYLLSGNGRVLYRNS